MKAKLEWLTAEEGRIVFFETEGTRYTVQFFVTGEEEAEFRLQDIVFPQGWKENTKIRKEIILKVTKIIKETFRLLWEEGLEAVALMEHNGSKLAEILDSTKVVRKIYSEYMMCRRFSAEKTTDSGDTFLKVMPEEDGYVCENKEHTFFCRLLPYESKMPGETCFYLYEVEVDKSARNRGIATGCLTELFRWLAKEVPVTVYLQVGSYNEPAVHLYEKLGFKVSEELCYYAMEE